MSAEPEAAALVRRSIERYRRAHRGYDRRHKEIFNPVEQGRLRQALAEAVGAIETPQRPRRALDFGCGSGNVTAHLLDLGLRVTAADVSPEFVEKVARRFGARGVEVVRLNGLDLAGIPDASYDLVAAYSVLHHIPDYVAILDELVRVLRPGGVLHLDHEANDGFWAPDGCGHRFRLAVEEHEAARPALWNPVRHRWQRFLQPTWLAIRFRPAWFFGREGDIHVWAEDRIEWSRIEDRLDGLRCEPVRRDDYLHFQPAYPRALWEQWRDAGCTDMRALSVRRLG